jgi:hypothetical protein
VQAAVIAVKIFAEAKLQKYLMEQKEFMKRLYPLRKARAIAKACARHPVRPRSR